MKVTDIERIIYQLYEIDKLNFNQIAKSLNLSSSAVREKYNKMLRVVEAEQTDPIAQLNIGYSTYQKLRAARDRHKERNAELGINLDTIEGLIEAVNDRFETYNHCLYFDNITPITIKDIMEALKEAGYELKEDKLDLGLSLSYDLICNNTSRYIEFDIKDSKGIFKFESDGTNCQIFLNKATKYPKDEIKNQIISIMKELGYLF